jgi:hypothetical protein
VRARGKGAGVYGRSLHILARTQKLVSSKPTCHKTHTLSNTTNHYRQFSLLRDITGEQFAEAINEALGPRMKLTGETPALQQFVAFFASRQLPKDTRIAFVWPLEAPGKDVTLQAVVVPPGGNVDLVSTAPEVGV